MGTGGKGGSPEGGVGGGEYTPEYVQYVFDTAQGAFHDYLDDAVSFGDAARNHWLGKYKGKYRGFAKILMRGGMWDAFTKYENDLIHRKAQKEGRLAGNAGELEIQWMAAANAFEGIL